MTYSFSTFPDQSSLPPGKPIEILLVEDNPGDARLMIEALKVE
jgi:hypothetical protein